MPELCTIDPITCRSSNAIYERHDWYGDNGQINRKPDIQHHPLNLTGNRDKDIKDISKRLEVIEKLLKYKRWYPHNRNREWNSPNQNQTQNRDQNPNRNQNRNQNQNQNQDNQNKQEDNQPKANEEGSQSKTEHTDKKDLNK